MSLRFRLNLLITTLLLLFMVATGVVIVKETRTSIQERVEAAVRVTTQLLDTIIVSAFNGSDADKGYQVLHDFLVSLGHVRSSDILLYDNVGRLIYQSPPSKYRSEVTPPQWFVSLVSPKPEAVMKRVGAATLMVRSDPAGAIRDAWKGVLPLLWVAGGFFVLLNLVLYWALGQALRPMQGVLKAIDSMQQGDMSVRLPSFSLPEFHQIAQSFNRMAASLETSTEESRRLALVVKQTGDAIMMHGLDGNISLWNPAAEKLFGYSAADIIGKSAALLMPQGREHELKRNLVTIAERKLIENVETQRVTRSGRVLEIVLSAAPLIEPHENKVIGEICTMRDVTERKRMEEAERELEENRQLTQIIQHHIEDERRSLARELHDELGQYVTAVKTFAVAIGNKTKETMPEVASSAQTIVSAANHIYDGMHNIIRQLRPGALDNLGLTETLRDAVATWQNQNPQMKFSLNFSGELQGLGETININLYRIVQESVTNAVRYSEASELHIHLARTAAGKISLKVQDNGVGMNTESVDQTQHFGLLGMRERVQALNGVFSVDSEMGKGVLINVEIPND